MVASEFASDSVSLYEKWVGWHAELTLTASTDLSAHTNITLPAVLDADFGTGPQATSAAGQHLRGWMFGRLVVWAAGTESFTVQLWGRNLPGGTLRHEENIASVAVGSTDLVRIERAIISPFPHVDVLADGDNVALEIFISIRGYPRGV